MGSVGNSTNNGLNDDYVITKFQLQEDNKLRQKRYELYQILKKSGYFGDDQEAIDDAFKKMSVYPGWDTIEYQSKHPESNREVTAEEYVLLKGGEAFNTYMSFDEYKKAMLLMGNFPRVDGTLSQGMRIYYGGASKNGYGRGNDARERWDSKYGFSSFIDNHKNLWLNTNNTLYRGLRLSDGSMKSLQAAVNSGDTIDFRGPSSWTLSKRTATLFAENSLVGQRNQNIVIFQDVTKGARNAMPFTYGHDSEVVYSGTSKFNVVSISQDDKGVYYVKVKKAKK